MGSPNLYDPQAGSNQFALVPSCSLQGLGRVLAYNRGEQQTARDLKFVVNEQNNKCSICALTADRSKLDEAFRSENVYYVPRFFAAAIIGENPAAFGLQAQPLSAH